MRYTVTYEQQALDALMRFYINAADRQAISKASNEIDRLLKTSPETCGMPFHVFRRLTVSPLEVMYFVSPDDCMVRVYTVRLLSQP